MLMYPTLAIQVRQSRNLLDPFMTHGTACWWAKSHEASSHASYDVEKTWVSRVFMTRVFTSLKIAMKPSKARGAFPVEIELN